MGYGHLGTFGLFLFGHCARPGNPDVVQSVFVDAEPPKVRVTPSGPLSVRAGESVTLECSVTGKPRPSISWTKQGSETSLVSTTTDATASLQVV